MEYYATMKKNGVDVCVLIGKVLWGILSLKSNMQPWLVWLSGLSAGLWTGGSPVWFPVGVQVWVVGQVPGGEHVGGNQTLIFLSLSFSFPSPLFKNG